MHKCGTSYTSMIFCQVLFIPNNCIHYVLWSRNRLVYGKSPRSKTLNVLKRLIPWEQEQELQQQQQQQQQKQQQQQQQQEQQQQQQQQQQKQQQQR